MKIRNLNIRRRYYVPGRFQPQIREGVRDPDFGPPGTCRSEPVSHVGKTETTFLDRGPTPEASTHLEKNQSA